MKQHEVLFTSFNSERWRAWRWLTSWCLFLRLHLCYFTVVLTLNCERLIMCVWYCLPHSHLWSCKVRSGHLIATFDHFIKLGVHRYVGIRALTCRHTHVLQSEKILHLSQRLQTRTQDSVRLEMISYCSIKTKVLRSAEKPHFSNTKFVLSEVLIVESFYVKNLGTIVML